MENEIWVLGSKNKNANRSFLWNEKIPNLADADTIIVNLQSLDQKNLDAIENEIYDYQSALVDKLINGKTIVFITETEITSSSGDFNNYNICPLGIYSHDVAKGTKIFFNKKENPFSNYLKHVKSFSFIIDDVDKGKIVISYSSLIEPSEYQVKDNDGHRLGCCFYVDQRGDKMTGNLILLPPVTSISVDESIDKIIEALGEEKIETPAPSWVKTVKIQGLDNVLQKITSLNTKRTELDEQIKSLEVEKNNLEKYSALLYAQDNQLERIVHEAFNLLGFEEIRQIRNANDEDWVIELKSINDLEYGLMEVKGRNGKTTQADIVQCNKWVDDYLQMDPPKKTKGIFITNQYRLNSYPDSKDDRTKFEPNEKGYAETRKICIIPTYVLFEAVNDVLKGTKKSRVELEKKIANTNGLLTKL